MTSHQHEALQVLLGMVRSQTPDIHAKPEEQKLLAEDIDRTEKILCAISGHFSEQGTDQEQDELLKQIGLRLPTKPCVQQPAAPSGTLLKEGGLWLDAFTTVAGHLGITITKDHPDDDTSWSARGIYFDAEGNLRAITADPYSNKKPD